MKKKIKIGKSVLEIEIKRFRERTLKDNIILGIIILFVIIIVYLIMK
jgi:hypothetical protein